MLNSAWYWCNVSLLQRMWLTYAQKPFGKDFSFLRFSIHLFFLSVFFELKLFHQVSHRVWFYNLLSVQQEGTKDVHTLFPLYPGCSKISRTQFIAWACKCCRAQDRPLVLPLSSPLSDRKPIGLQQQLSSGSHWPQNSTFCLSVGRGQLREVANQAVCIQENMAQLAV